MPARGIATGPPLGTPQGSRQRLTVGTRCVLGGESPAVQGDPVTRRLRDLESVTDAALAYLPLDALLDQLLTRVTEILDVDTAAILLLENEGRQLVARAAKGIEEEVARGVRIPVGRGFAGRIASELRPIRIPDIDDAEIFNPLLREKGLRSLLGVPLLVEGSVIGVLHVGTLTPREFSAEDADLLQRAATAPRSRSRAACPSASRGWPMQCSEP